MVEAVSVGLSLRDAVLIASGAPRRLRPVPGALLWGELAAGLSSVAAGIPILFRKDGPAAATDAADRFRRASVALLFALHTVRFWIYLRPDQGRRASFLPQRQ